MNDSVSISGHVTIIIKYLDGTRETVEFENLITNSGLNLMVNGLSGASAKLTYLALGTSTTTPAPGDTHLGAEVFRKQVTNYSLSGTGVLISTTYILPNEALFNIKELGWFGGDATASANSGTLYARALYAGGGHLKTNLESLTITRTDTLTAS